MRHRNLGRSGLLVSEISYGNWITHGGQIDDAAAQACVAAALDAGITTFDTADVYAGGRAESVLGAALAGVRRESVEIFTKVFWTTGPGPNDRGLSRKHVLASIDASLGRLGVDYVDLYQAHRFDHHTPLEETMSGFADIVHSGKARYVGVSEWTADEIRDGSALADEMGVMLISNQPQHSILWRVIEAEVLPACEELGVGQIVWSPLAQGVLTGKYRPGQPPPEGSRADDATHGTPIRTYLRDEVLDRVQDLAPIAADCGLSMPQLAIAWVLQDQRISSAIVGASRPEQVRQNVEASGVELGADVMAAIDAAVGPVVVDDPGITAEMSPR